MRQRIKDVPKSTLDWFNPELIVVEQGLNDHPVVDRAIEWWPEAEVINIEGSRYHMEAKTIGEAIERGKNTLVFVTTKKFMARFEHQSDPFCPGFHKFNPASNGCYYRCEYCYLPGTYRKLIPYIKINLNTDHMLSEVEREIARHKRVIFNIGEMMDSLSLDYLTGLSKILVPFFAKQEGARLLLLTKSDCVENLMNLDHRGHTIVSFSLNADEMARKYEHGAASVADRIRAARKCQEAGYPVRVRFDPMIFFTEWKKAYIGLVRSTFEQLSPQRVTVGSTRFHPNVRSQHSQRFPGSDLFMDKSLFNPKRNADGKIRYWPAIRREMYSFMIGQIRNFDRNVPISLCKEEHTMWEAVGLDIRKCECNCMY